MTERQLESVTQPFEAAPDIQLYFSNLNLPERFIATAGVAAHRRVMDELNGDGVLYPEMQYEITPTRRLAVDSLLGKLGIEQEEQRPFAGRLHQAWPQGLLRGALNAPSARGAVLNAAAYLVMPETRRSLKTIQRMSNQLGGVPAVVYADQKDNDGHFMNLSGVGSMNVTQIMPEPMAAMSAPDPYNYRRFHDSLWHRGVGGIVVDNHHLVRAADFDPGLRLDWERVLYDVEQTGTNMMGAHASAGRIDSKHEADRKRSQGELAAVFEGPDAIAKTLMGRALARSYEIWRNQRAHRFLPEGRIQESAAARVSYLETYKNSDGSLRWGEYFAAVAQDPIEAQAREESIYRQSLRGRLDVFPLTVEIPHKGMAAHRGARRLGMSELVSMHRDVAQSWLAFFGGLRQAYDRNHPHEHSNAGSLSEEY